MKQLPNILLVTLLLMFSLQTTATKTTVNTLATLTSVFSAARPGDTIVIANGRYNWGKISISNTFGTSTSAWIVVKAESRSGVVFTDSTYFMFSGTRILVDGFRFANGNSKTNAVMAFRTSSTVFANYSRISNITFDNYNSIDSVENEWVAFYGVNNRLDHCTFLNKSNARATVVIWYSTATFPDRSVSTYHRIDSNYFAGRSYMGGNGGETIRVGVGNNSRTFGYNVIEYNLFEGLTQSEPEVISNKSYYNTYRYNTFLNSNGGLTLRMGKYCNVYGNFFINNDATKTESYGVRIIDKGHKVYNNYFEGLLGASGSLTSIRCPIITYNGSFASADSLNPLILNGAYLPADSALIANNTIVNCKGGPGIKLANYDGGLALNQPVGTRVANNVIKQTTGQAVYIEPSTPTLSFTSEGNLYNAPSGLGITNTTGFTNTAMTFGSRINGILTAPSLVQDASVNTSFYSALIGNLDAQGQTRSAIFDAGCDELNGTGSIIGNPLDSNLVGAGKPIIVVQNQTINFPAIATQTAGNADFNPGATATSGLAVSYTSSNTSVATIVNNNIHLVGYGTSTITANQSGNAYFNAAPSVSQTLTVNALTQTITFAAIPAKTVGNADFAPGATASSGLAISYTSSNTSVATILNGNIHIVGAGTSVITAAQSGNTTYAAAISVSQTLTVNALAQTITFAAIPAKIVGDADFNPGATATSGLAISYTSSNISVATILNGNIHIVGAGTSVITAAQSGNTSYSAATSVLQTLTVTKTYTYSPTSTTVLSGSVNSGTFGNLATNNASYYVVNSTTTGTRTVSWYGSVKITQAPSSVSKLTLTYDGKNSASKTQILYLYNWVTAAWVQIDSRTVSTTDVLITNTQNAPANYISSLGEIRLRVYSSAGTANYTCSGDWMQFAIQSTSALRTTSSLPIVNTTETISSQTALFPNPSYSNSELKYFVAKNSKVSINIYNANGIKVKELATDKNESIGIHTQHIESSNLTNGVYFIKLLVDGKLETIKLIVRH